MRYPNYGDLESTGVDLRRTVSYQNMGGKNSKNLKEGRLKRNREVYKAARKGKRY